MAAMITNASPVERWHFEERTSSSAQAGQTGRFVWESSGSVRSDGPSSREVAFENYLALMHQHVGQVVSRRVVVVVDVLRRSVPGTLPLPVVEIEDDDVVALTWRRESDTVRIEVGKSVAVYWFWRDGDTGRYCDGETTDFDFPADVVSRIAPVKVPPSKTV